MKPFLVWLHSIKDEKSAIKNKLRMLRQNHRKTIIPGVEEGRGLPVFSEGSVPLLLLVVLGSESANGVSVFNERKI